jgi:hypothetical protein
MERAMTVPLSNNELDRLAIDVDARQGERMLSRVHSFLGRFISYPNPHAHAAHTLWCVHCHLMDQWESTPRLAFLSAEPESGKTRALEITELLVPHPVQAVNVSPSYLFRKVGSEDGATILFDEIDTVFGPKAKENEELRGLLNAGHRRGAVAGRCAVKGKETVTEEIPAYAAVALAGIGWLPDTILSRSVIIRMRRRHAGEKVEPYRRRIHASEGSAIRDTVAVWARGFDLKWPELPPGIEDRSADVWEPLIAIADAIGGDWPKCARDAAVALVAAAKEVEPSLGVRLLSHVRNVLDVEKLPTKILLEKLHAIPESPWRELRGKPLDDRGLANRLRQYDIKSRDVRTGAGTLKGYYRSDFQDAWARYLPPIGQKSATSATSATSVMDQAVGVADSVAVVLASATAVANGHSEKASIHNGVADVAHVADLASMGRNIVCAHCQRPGQLQLCSVDGQDVRLHRHCQDAWLRMEIPPSLDRRAEQDSVRDDSVNRPTPQ